MTFLYSWDASAPECDGGGVTGSEDSAKAAAETWMRDHRADAAHLERVRLVMGGWGLVTTYGPTGHAWTAHRRSTREITWTRDGLIRELASSWPPIPKERCR